MIFKTILSNKAHPEFGQATIPFPIPDSEYDRTIGLLEDMGYGDWLPHRPELPDRLAGQYVPHPNRLVTQSINVDELDYLAKRLDGFCKSEDDKFEAMAVKRGLPAQ